MKYFKNLKSGRIEPIEHFDTIKRLLKSKEWIEIPEPTEEIKLQDLIDDDTKLSDLVNTEVKKPKNKRGKKSEHSNNITG